MPAAAGEVVLHVGSQEPEADLMEALLARSIEYHLIEVFRVEAAELSAEHRANLAARLPGGLTLTDALARRDMLDLRLKVLRRAAAAASERQIRYSNSEVKMIAVIPARDLQKQVDALAKERRELETQIQQVNWLTELPE